MEPGVHQKNLPFYHLNGIFIIVRKGGICVHHRHLSPRRCCYRCRFLPLLRRRRRRCRRLKSGKILHEMNLLMGTNCCNEAKRVPNDG